MIGGTTRSGEAWGSHDEVRPLLRPQGEVGNASNISTSYCHQQDKERYLILMLCEGGPTANCSSWSGLACHTSHVYLDTDRCCGLAGNALEAEFDSMVIHANALPQPLSWWLSHTLLLACVVLNDCSSNHP